MTRGLASAVVKFNAICACCECGTERPSSSANRVEIGTTFLEVLPQVIEEAITRQIVQPPIDWEMRGRGAFRCETCRTKKEVE